MNLRSVLILSLLGMSVVSLGQDSFTRTVVGSGDIERMPNWRNNPEVQSRYRVPEEYVGQNITGCSTPSNCNSSVLYFTPNAQINPCYGDPKKNKANGYTCVVAKYITAPEGSNKYYISRTQAWVLNKYVEDLTAPKPGLKPVVEQSAEKPCFCENTNVVKLADYYQKIFSESLNLKSPAADYKQALPQISKLLGECIDEKKIIRVGNAYDNNLGRLWENKKNKVPIPKITINSRWPDNYGNRALNYNDLRIIDGLARTIWGEARSCASAENGASTGGHFEMISRVMADRVSFITPLSNDVHSMKGLSENNWREFRRDTPVPDWKRNEPKWRTDRIATDDGTFTETDSMNPLESMISKRQAFSVWNPDDNSLAEVSCPAPALDHSDPRFIKKAKKRSDKQIREEKKTWDRAVELATQLYLSPDKFDAENYWRENDKGYKITQYTHAVVYSTKNPANYWDPKTKKFFKWKRLTDTIHVKTVLGTQSLACGAQDKCSAAILWETIPKPVPPKKGGKKK